MVKTFVKIEGLSALEDALKELPKATGRNVIRRALNAAAKPMIDNMKAMAPRGRTGRLKESITATTRFTKGDAGKRAFAEAMRGGSSRAEAIEAARSANAEAGGSDITSGLTTIGPSRRAFYGLFQEFGTRRHGPKPFMRPAWEEGKSDAAISIRDVLEEEIEKARARIAKKQAREIAKVKSL